MRGNATWVFSNGRPSCSGIAEANDIERYRNLRSEGVENN